MKYKMYVVVNKDLDMSAGKTAAQVGHAISTYIYNAFKYDSKIALPNVHKRLEAQRAIREWMSTAQTKIVLKGREKDLTRLLNEHEGAIEIRDKGLTEVAPNSLTCVGLGLIDTDKEIPRYIRRLQLLA